MDTSRGLLLGRPFRGIAILWRKSIGNCIQIHKYNDSRVMAIEYNNGNRKLLAVNIYTCLVMTARQHADLQAAQCKKEPSEMIMVDM